MLKAKVDVDQNENLKRKVGKALKDYSEVFEFASLIPVVGKYAAKFLKEAAKAGSDALEPADLETLMNNLETAL